MGLLKEFREFIARGNVFDLSVAVVIGGAFGKIVTSFVNDIIMPVLGLILGRINFTGLKVVISEATEEAAEVSFNYGAFLQSVIDFLIIGAAIFLFIKAVSKLKRKQEQEEESEEKKEEEPVLTKQEELLEEIRDLLKNKVEVSREK